MHPCPVIAAPVWKSAEQKYCFPYGWTSEYHFVRCNKGYLVNLRHINLIKTDTVVVAGEELIISRRKRNEFMLAVMDYYGSGGR